MTFTPTEKNKIKDTFENYFDMFTKAAIISSIMDFENTIGGVTAVINGISFTVTATQAQLIGSHTRWRAIKPVVKAGGIKVQTSDQTPPTIVAKPAVMDITTAIDMVHALTDEELIEECVQWSERHGEQYNLIGRNEVVHRHGRGNISYLEAQMTDRQEKRMYVVQWGSDGECSLCDELLEDCQCNVYDKHPAHLIEPTKEVLIAEENLGKYAITAKFAKDMNDHRDMINGLTGPDRKDYTAGFQHHACSRCSAEVEECRCEVLTQEMGNTEEALQTIVNAHYAKVNAIIEADLKTSVDNVVKEDSEITEEGLELQYQIRCEAEDSNAESLL